MTRENTQSPSLVVLQLLNRCPCFQRAEQAQLWSLNTCLCRPPCQVEAKAQCHSSDQGLLDQQGLMAAKCPRCHPLEGARAHCCGGHVLAWLRLGLGYLLGIHHFPGRFCSPCWALCRSAGAGNWWTQFKPVGRVLRNALAAGHHILKVYSGAPQGWAE